MQFVTTPCFKVFSIAPSLPFLSTLVDHLHHGTLIADFDARDPLQLSQCCFYVPTQRAARALRLTLMEKSDGQVQFLPDIRPLGDLADDEGVDFFVNGADAVALDPPIEILERLLVLARLIRPWRERLPEHLRQLFGLENIVIPASVADAIWLARDLANLMDAVETQEADWAHLQDIGLEMVAEWWQVTVEFLQIVTRMWPQILAENHLSNPAWWRSKMIRAQAQRLSKNPPSGPVIAAGSTGSIPATAALLKVIAQLPQGAVVLGGLDPFIDEASWQALSDTQTDPSVFGHPQYGLKKLLDHIGVKREMVVHLEAGVQAALQRDFYLSKAMLPAPTSDEWSRIPLNEAEKVAAFSEVCLIEAAGEREEALAIAIALREALEQPENQVALVTSDRNLARRVVSELKRFGIRADDSGGQPLSQTEPATLLRLLLDCVFRPGDPVAFLSLLKHPLTRLGRERASFRQQVERFELFALRGGAGRISLTEISHFIAEFLLKITELNHGNFAESDPGFIETAIQFGAVIGEAARPLKQLREQEGEVSVQTATVATIAAFENFGRDESGALDALYAGEAGQVMVAFLRALVAENSGLTFQPQEWPQILDGLMAAETVRRRATSHPRLAIWGGLEARLQPLDMVVIGGMNEGVWPQSCAHDPFMSRAMKAEMGLEPPERRIGLAAHDFQMLMGIKQVVLSRASRQENAPAVPSRWLQRLMGICGEDVAQAMRERGAKYLYWARECERQPDIPFAPRPCPTPPLEQRPKHFSITEIDTLRRDPYAIYAKKILKLKPLKPLISEPKAAERGQLYHAIVAAFADMLSTSQKRGGAVEDWQNLARFEFDQMQLPKDVEAIWWPRFQLLIPGMMALEQAWEPRQRYPEIVAKAVEIIAGSGIMLAGRADRIDVLTGKMAEVIDFKTGSTPSLKEARCLDAPQLALEGALLMRGAFEACGVCEPADFIYIRLGDRGEIKIERVLTKGSKSAAGLAEEAWMRLERLVGSYLDPAKGYLSHAVLTKRTYEGDYDHLARFYEWSSGGEGMGEEGSET